jgi:DNA-binding transcriptional ArsR family regulator
LRYITHMSRPLADDSVFRVMGHPARRAVLDQLRRGERPVNELPPTARLSRATMSEHLRMLRNAGVIIQRR